MLPKQHWNVLTVSDFFPFFLYSPVEIFFKNKYCFEFKVKKKKKKYSNTFIAILMPIGALTKAKNICKICINNCFLLHNTKTHK